MEGPLIEEFELALGEMRIGEGRQEALKKISQRSASPEMASFVRAIIQADQLGISLGRILRVQATDSRLKRQMLAEERAMKAPIEVSGREQQFGQELAEQSASLERRASALADTEAELEEREQQISARLAELDGALEAKEEVARAEARIHEREQLLERKMREFKSGDEERAAAGKQLKEKLEDLAKRENEIAQSEARAASSNAEAEARHEKLMRALEASE